MEPQKAPQGFLDVWHTYLKLVFEFDKFSTLALTQCTSRGRNSTCLHGVCMHVKNCTTSKGVKSPKTPPRNIFSQFWMKHNTTNKQQSQEQKEFQGTPTGTPKNSSPRNKHRILQLSFKALKSTKELSLFVIVNHRKPTLDLIVTFNQGYSTKQQPPMKA